MNYTNATNNQNIEIDTEKIIKLAKILEDCKPRLYVSKYIESNKIIQFDDGEEFCCAIHPDTYRKLNSINGGLSATYKLIHSSDCIEVDED